MRVAEVDGFDPGRISDNRPGSGGRRGRGCGRGRGPVAVGDGQGGTPNAANNAAAGGAAADGGEMSGSVATVAGWKMKPLAANYRAKMASPITFPPNMTMEPVVRLSSDSAFLFYSEYPPAKKFPGKSVLGADSMIALDPKTGRAAGAARQLGWPGRNVLVGRERIGRTEPIPAPAVAPNGTLAALCEMPGSTAEKPLQKIAILDPGADTPRVLDCVAGTCAWNADNNLWVQHPTGATRRSGNATVPVMTASLIDPKTGKVFYTGSQHQEKFGTPDPAGLGEGTWTLSPGADVIAARYDMASDDPWRLDFYDARTGEHLGKAGVEGYRTNTVDINRTYTTLAFSPDGSQFTAALDLPYDPTDGEHRIDIHFWDMKTGALQGTQRSYYQLPQFTWYTNDFVLYAERQLIDARLRSAVAEIDFTDPTAEKSQGQQFTLLNEPNDGRLWAIFRGKRAVALDPPVDQRPKIFKPGDTLKIGADTGDADHDKRAIEALTKAATADGFKIGDGGWTLKLSARVENGGTLSTKSGGDIPTPTISGRVELIDPAGAVQSKTELAAAYLGLPASKYRGQSSTGATGPLSKVTPYNFPSSPGPLMAAETWDEFLNVRLPDCRWPRVLAQGAEANGRLPEIVVPVPAG